MPKRIQIIEISKNRYKAVNVTKEELENMKKKAIEDGIDNWRVLPPNEAAILWNKWIDEEDLK